MIHDVHAFSALDAAAISGKTIYGPGAFPLSVPKRRVPHDAFRWFSRGGVAATVVGKGLIISVQEDRPVP
jgi:hypothetical protein